MEDIEIKKMYQERLTCCLDVVKELLERELTEHEIVMLKGTFENGWQGCVETMSKVMDSYEKK